MNARKLCLTFGSFAALSLTLVLHAQAAPAMAQSTPGIAISPAKNSVAADPDVVEATEHLRLVTVEYKGGATTEAQLSESTIALAKAQVRSGIRLNNSVVVQQALATIVAQRQQQLHLVQAEYTAGEINSNDVIPSQIALAQANIRINLYDIVSLRKQALSQVQIRNNNGIATTKELLQAQDAYQEAQRLFSEGGEGS